MAGAGDHVSRNLQQSKSGTRMVAAKASDSSLFDLPEPPWTADSEVVKCEACGSQFSFFLRKHHCRFCGHIYCSKCCDSSITSVRQGFVDPVRLCGPCNAVVKKDNDFMTVNLPLLLDGASFLVNGECAVVCSVNKKTHAALHVGELHADIPLKSITKIEDIREDAAASVTGVALRYSQDGLVADLELRLDGEEANKKNSLKFIGALKKGLVILHGPTPSSPRKK